MKAWLVIGVLLLVGCQGSEEVSERVAFRGPDVTIEVEPAGRAERLKLAPTAKPDPVNTAPKVSGEGSEQKSKTQAPVHRPKPKSDNSEDRQPREEDQQVAQDATSTDDGDSIAADETPSKKAPPDSTPKSHGAKEKPKKPKKDNEKLPPDEDFYPTGKSVKDPNRKNQNNNGGGDDDDAGLGLFPVKGNGVK